MRYAERMADIYQTTSDVCAYIDLAAEADAELAALREENGRLLAIVNGPAPTEQDRFYARAYRAGYDAASGREHTCHDQCDLLPCVQRREIERLGKREAHLVEMLKRCERDVQRALRDPNNQGHACGYRVACEAIQQRAAGLEGKG